MKKIVTLLTLVFVLNQSVVKADEGMWLVHLIGEKTYADMTKKGLKLTKEQLYSMNKSSLKDAIVIFGGGCTGEIVSKEGLLFTNHHCGYGNIVAASTVEHDYLTQGFWAKSKQEEIPCPGLGVLFLQKIEDVTDSVMARLNKIPANEQAMKLQGLLREMGTKASAGTNYEIRISSFFKGNQFLQFTYQPYKDVRLVGTPPENVGKFGGDTDNWEWPRHTGDFSVFRVYQTADGKAPTAYDKTNVPLQPKHFLPVSLKGINDGDYAMIYGYPGSTNRYETSAGIKLKVDIDNPSLVKLRDERLKLMHAEMVKDPKVKLQLATPYATIANYWKFFDGESKQLIKYNVIGQKEKEEAAFEAWAKGKSEYDNLFSNITKAHDTWKPYAKGRVYLIEGILGSPLISFASNLKGLETGLQKQDDVSKLAAQLKTAYDKFIKDENVASDKNILAAMLKMYHNEVDAAQQPTAFYNTMGDLSKDETYKKYAESVFAGTMLLDSTKTRNFLAKPDLATLQNDPAYKVAVAFVNNYNDQYNKYYMDFISSTYVMNNKYLKGILEMKKGAAIYPDANFTMRVSYGNVKSYTPRDGVKYAEICTLKGVMEKYKPKDYEFDLPAKLIELIKNKDYGQYIDKKANDIVVTFITTNDITGGNSGSPVINGKGELIGLAFDGNYEALSHKIAFDKDLNRTICVDVRYVLFLIDKLGGATNIINELNLVKQ